MARPRRRLLAKKHEVAYKETRELRQILQELNTRAGWKKTEDHYQACKNVTDLYAKGAGGALRTAIKKEREHAVARAAPMMDHEAQALIQNAYVLVQKLPTFRELPDSEHENKLRAIEALIKSKGADAPGPVLQSIRLILDPSGLDKITTTPPSPKKAKAKPKPKPGVAAGGLTTYVMAWDESTVTASSGYHGLSVEEGQLGPSVPFDELPVGAPVTWGSKSAWYDKGTLETASVAQDEEQVWVPDQWWSNYTGG